MSGRIFNKPVFRIALSFISIILLIIIAFCYRQQIMNWLSVKGSTGIFRSVLVMTVFCIIPIPAEVAMIENIRAHGDWIGMGVNFAGAILGAEILFLIARFVRISLIHSPLGITTLNTFRLLSRENKKIRMICLLLLARVLPVPAKIVDLSAGMVKSVSWWDFTWTTAIGIIPYQFLAMILYHGWHTSRIIFILVCIAIIILILAFIRILRRQKLKLE